MRIDIKNAFDKHNIEIKSLAEKIGVSRQSIHYFINQGDKNSFDNIKKISEVSGIPEEDFFCRSPLCCLPPLRKGIEH